jgi:SecD/SecF fusion protein
MENYAGGVVFVFRNVSPAITVSEFQGRIRDIQNQPDFANKTLNPTEVVGLRPAKGRYSAFAVFVRSAQTEVLARAAATESLAEESLELISGALEREQAMVATNFDAAIAGKAAQTAIMAILLSWIAIVVYLWVRFGSIRWGLAAVVCLIHDVIIVVGLLAASGWLSKTAFGRALGIGSFKIDLAMVAAVLTVIGYSVNDTIVVFDRIRENRGKLATVSVHALNASINQTLSRTMLTSTTTLLVVVIMYVIGGEAIRPFSFALLAGILFGTYSSVAIASPLLMGFRRAMVARTTGAAAEKGD